MNIKITQYKDVLVETSIETHLLENVISEVRVYKYDKTSKKLTIHLERNCYDFDNVIKVEIL